MQGGLPIAFCSKTYIPAERNYTTTEQEMLAIVHALSEWRCYLEGSQVCLNTDHNPLTYFTSVPTLSRRMARWVEILAPYDYTIKYVSGRHNVADPVNESCPA